MAGTAVKDLRSKVYEPEADSFLFLDALDAESGWLQETVVSDAVSTGAPVYCLEVGPGSGIVLSHLVCHTLLARALESTASPSVAPSIVAWAVDVNPYALEATQLTFRSTFEALQKEFPDRVGPTSAATATTPVLELVRGDLASMWTGMRQAVSGGVPNPPAVVDSHQVQQGGVFDVVLFNPPYVPTSMEELTRVMSQSSDPNHCIESAWSGGPDGRIVVDRLLQQLPWILRYPSTPLKSSPQRQGLGLGGVAYIVALEENLIEDLKALARCASHEMVEKRQRCSPGPHHPPRYCLQCTVVAARYTGERLRVVRFEWAPCECTKLAADCGSEK